jgi:hypothetical protein
MHAGHETIRTAISRRTFLAASGLTYCDLSLPSLVGAAPASHTRAKSIILIWLSGGASHIDTWDMKPDAPVEYRGEFKPIATSVPGVRICEHLPAGRPFRLAGSGYEHSLDPANHGDARSL